MVDAGVITARAACLRPSVSMASPRSKPFASACVASQCTSDARPPPRSTRTIGERPCTLSSSNAQRSFESSPTYAKRRGLPGRPHPRRGPSLRARALEPASTTRPRRRHRRRASPVAYFERTSDPSRTARERKRDDRRDADGDADATPAPGTRVRTRRAHDGARRNARSTLAGAEREDILRKDMLRIIKSFARAYART